jgi:hypothetical protein
MFEFTKHSYSRYGHKLRQRHANTPASWWPAGQPFNYDISFNAKKARE